MVDIARAAASVGGGDERVTGDGPRPVVGIAGGAGSQSQGPLVGLHAGGISQLQALQIGGGVVVVLLYMAARNRKKLKKWAGAGAAWPGCHSRPESRRSPNLRRGHGLHRRHGVMTFGARALWRSTLPSARRTLRAATTHYWRVKNMHGV